MIKSYLTIAFRYLIRHRLFTTINILGLSAGLTTAIILLLFAQFQLGYDQFHSRHKDTYILYKERITPTGTQPTYDTWYPLLSQLESDFPEIEIGTRISENHVVVEQDANRFNEQCYYVDASYFKVFDFPLAFGDNNNPLPSINSVIISEQLSKKYFGNENAIGKNLVINFDQVYTISGILKPYPQNASIASELILPIESEPGYSESENDWGSSSILTVIQLRQDADPSQLAEKFPGLIQKIWDTEIQQRTNFKLLPLEATFETFVGDPKDVYILLSVGVGLILIVVINFINLSASSSLERFKEVSMRKVFGAQRLQLVHQFLYESIIISLFSLCCSILIAFICLPLINQQFDLHLSLDISDPGMILSLIGISLLLGVIAGSIPSFKLAYQKIQRGLKVFKQEKMGLRNGLITFQFGTTMILIIGLMVIGEQIQYLKRSDMGFKLQDQLIIPISAEDFVNADEGNERLQTFKNILREHNSVINLSSSRHIPLSWTGSNLFVRPEGWQGDPLRMRFTYHDADFFSTYQIPIIEGPGFKDDSAGDQRESVIINESALRAFGWESIQGKKLVIGETTLEVVGLIQNFNYESLREQVAPILHFHRSASNRVHRYITLNIKKGSEKETVDYVKSQWSMLDDSGRLPFNYFFLDEDIDNVYHAEDRLFAMIKMFAVIVFIISCIGLYGLSTFNVEKRKKEIGIRRVLGATISNIVSKLYQHYLKLAFIGFLFATPVSYWLMRDWLAGYANHTSPSPGIFILTFAGISLFTILIISFKSIQIANQDPARVIRED